MCLKSKQESKFKHSSVNNVLIKAALESKLISESLHSRLGHREKNAF